MAETANMLLFKLELPRRGHIARHQEE